MKVETIIKMYTAKEIKDKIKKYNHSVFVFDRRIARLKRAYRIKTGKDMDYGRF